MKIPTEIQNLQLHEVRSHLLSSSQAYMTLLQTNKGFKDKLQKVSLQLKDLPKYKEELQVGHATQLSK